MKHGIIISLGSVNADFQVRVDQKPGSTTTMLAHDFIRLSGGKAANVAYLARRLGVSALLLARVGNDDLGEQALQSLEEIGVDLSWVRKVEDVSTGFSMIAVPADGKKNIILAPNANDVWKEEDKKEVLQAIEQAPAESVLVVDYEVPAFIVEQAIITAYEKNIAVILDPSPTDRVDQQLFSKINYLSPDASETEGLTGIRPVSFDSALQAAKKLIATSLETAIVRLEEGGCVVAQANTILHVPPISVNVVDTTGAGDAFAGAFAVAILEKRSLLEATCFASAVSLYSVSTYGSQPAYPSREQIQSLYERVKADIQTIDP